MKEVLEFVEKKKQEFAQLSLFEYMQDKSIDPRQRLAFIPCLAPFAMSVADLWKYDLRNEPTNDPIQKIINEHTYEDEDHCFWYLEDIHKLGFDKTLSYSESLKFLWSDDTKKTRQLYHKLRILTFQAKPILVLAAIHAIEATGNIALGLTAEVVEELQSTPKQKYRFFGNHHVRVEDAHKIKTEEIGDWFETIELNTLEKSKAIEVVEKVFEAFTECMDELMNYVYKQSIEQDSQVRYCLQ